MNDAEKWKKLYYELKSVALDLELQRNAVQDELSMLRKENKDLLDTVKACLVAAGGSEDEDELLRQLNNAGRKPSDFVRAQIGSLRKNCERYEWLRAKRTTLMLSSVMGIRHLVSSDWENVLDASIDSAMESGNG